MDTIFYESLKDTDHNVYAAEQVPSPCRLHFHRAFEINYVISGNADTEVEYKRFVAQTDDIVFIHRYYLHKSYDTHDHLKYVIAVPDHYSADFKEYFENETLPCLLTDKEFNKTLLPYIEKLVKHQNSLPQIVTMGFLNVIFGYLKAHYNAEKIHVNSKNVSIIVDILNYIDRHCHENLSLETLAKKFGYNKTYFSRLFNEHVGMPVKAYINNARLIRLAELQKKYPDANVTELALDAGFQSLATFYRIKNN